MPESDLIAILLLLPIEVEVIIKVLPSTAMVAPAIVILLAASATEAILAFKVIATSEPSTITVNVSTPLVKKLKAAKESPINVPALPAARPTPVASSVDTHATEADGR